MCDYTPQVSRGNKLYQSSVTGTCWYGIGIFFSLPSEFSGEVSEHLQANVPIH